MGKIFQRKRDYKTVTLPRTPKTDSDAMRLLVRAMAYIALNHVYGHVDLKTTLESHDLIRDRIKEINFWSIRRNVWSKL